jgi:hypothetical protein
MPLAKDFPLFKTNLPILFPITFAPKQNDVPAGLLAIHFSELIDPMLDVSECITICDIVYHDSSMCASVVASRNWLKSLLTSSIPDLKLHSLAVNVQHFKLEIDPDCSSIVFIEYIICIAK